MAALGGTMSSFPRRHECLATPPTRWESHSMKVLIIEDDTTIATNLYDYRESAGYEVGLASDGVMGLHLAVTQHGDAILLDLSLPGMDGLPICSKLR
jgi:CheY-like chemotaxis protein